MKRSTQHRVSAAGRRLGAIVGAVLALQCATIAAAAYRPGDVAADFSFVARKAFSLESGRDIAAGQIVRLSDLAGRVIFLEWFAVWCPFCVAAAPQVEAGIVEHYRQRGGNPHGIPVLHVAVNQEPRSFYQTQTDNFIAQQGFGLTVNDYDPVSTNKVRFMFQSGGQPIFAVISGLTNSPTHKPWQILVNHLGYGDRDFNLELANFRALIDQVKPAPPLPPPPPRLEQVRRGAEGAVEFTVHAPPGRSYRLEASADLDAWTTIRTLEGSESPHPVREPAIENRRFYRVVTP